ncbi:MAG TPA: glycosyltransferase family A protein [Gemmatirosa sp.]|nr:glycosyltransferase family A protein [Gemmatirosa sp.]
MIVPCYRQARYLPDAIESLRAQSHRNLEIIVVDDGSPDDVAEALRAHPDVQLVRHRHRGPSAARNAGLAHARGEYVAFLDADDVLYPDALARGLEALERHPDCAFAAGGHTVRVGGAIVSTYLPEHEGPAYAHMLRKNFIGMQGAVLFRRDALTRVGGFRDELVSCEDLDLYLRLLRHAPLALHDGVIAEYRRHEANSSDDVTRMFVGMRGALGAQWPYVRDRPELRAALAHGMATGRELFGEPVIHRAGRALASGRGVGAALRAVAVLVRHDPRHYGPRLLRYYGPRLLRYVLRRAGGSPGGPTSAATGGAERPGVPRAVEPGGR